MSISMQTKLGEGSQTGRYAGGSKDIAYLGPDGTYGQQAARAFIREYLGSPDLVNVPCSTISDAYERDSEYTVLPLENTIFGPVIETLDCFFSRLTDNTGSSQTASSSSNSNNSRKGKGKEIIATLDLPIRHCLVALKGTKLDKITIVKSHEQALGQSSSFLARCLPNAKRIPTDSTASAAESLLPIPGDDGDRGSQIGEVCAAICSRSVVDVYPELEVLYEGTQDRTDNYTRFVLMRTINQSGSRLNGHDQTTHSANSSSTSSSSFYLLDNPTRISRLLTSYTFTTIGSLHTRPITPMKGDTRVYPQAVFIELVHTRKDEGGSSISDLLEEGGISYLGSGNLVKLEP